MPRDPKRIPDILIELQQAWEKSPDLRLGQLLINLYAKNNPSPTPEDTLSGIFYTEDDKWVEMIKKEEK